MDIYQNSSNINYKNYSFNDIPKYNYKSNNIIYNNYNNRYNNNNNSINPIDNNNEETNSFTSNNVKININSNQISKASSSRFLSKVTVENTTDQQSILALLETFFSENNYNRPNYETSNESNKIIFTFDNEEIAFKFTKFLYSKKEKNEINKNINFYLNLVPNNNYNITKKSINRKRGLSTDSIQRLFTGIGPKKHEKKSYKINLNLDLGVSSPFLYPPKKNQIIKLNKSKNFTRDENNFEIYDGNMEGHKNYSKLPTKVLDSDYQLLRGNIFRTEVRSKWISPTDFKY